jgi:hypothetical protein
MTLGSPFNTEELYEESITLPEIPVIKVHDQPVMNGKILVDEILSGDQVWVAIYADQNGMPGQLIGYRRIIPGIYRQLEVEIDLSNATVVLYAIVHVDHENRGVFEFPGIDTPILNGEVPESHSFRITFPFQS